jgi:hypothetical protein
MFALDFKNTVIARLIYPLLPIVLSLLALGAVLFFNRYFNLVVTPRQFLDRPMEEVGIFLSVGFEMLLIVYILWKHRKLSRPVGAKVGVESYVAIYTLAEVKELMSITLNVWRRSISHKLVLLSFFLLLLSGISTFFEVEDLAIETIAYYCLFFGMSIRLIRVIGTRIRER